MSGNAPEIEATIRLTAAERSGGPWVMWKGTPYAHLMVPVSPTQGATLPPIK